MSKQSQVLRIMLGLPVIFFVFYTGGINAEPSEDYLNAVRKSERWIRSSLVSSPYGKIWPAVPGEPASVNSTLYSGVPGIVLFYLEAYTQMGNQGYLQAAEAGADYLMNILSKEKTAGLYTGISGIGFALEETFRLTQRKKYREGVCQCLDFLEKNAKDGGSGLLWDPVTDIIGGSAGTGLFLIYSSHRLQDKRWLDLAVRAGLGLIELGIPAEGGLKWAMSPEYPRLMPNFAHGTAGIAYFLASLYVETKDQKFLHAALSGAHYLLQVADTEGGNCLIFHHEPEGEDLFYLGWCHGPVGTSRLFYRLYQITGEREWIGWMERGAHAILESGIPEAKVPGFWNNVGLCCGSAGVADFFLDLYRLTRKTEYLKFARRLTADLLSRGTSDDQGMRWTQAEHRTRPDFLVAQTGLMQGAAGIGLWLLRMQAFEKGKKPFVIFPDSPFSHNNLSSFPGSKQSRKGEISAFQAGRGEEMDHDEEVKRRKIEELHRKDMAAAKVNDIDTLITLWTQDGVMLQPGKAPVIGKAAIWEYMQRQKAQSEGVKITEYRQAFEEIKIMGDWAFEWGTFTGAYIPRGGKEALPYRARLCRLLRRGEDGEWRVARAIWHDLPPD